MLLSFISGIIRVHIRYFKPPTIINHNCIKFYMYFYVKREKCQVCTLIILATTVLNLSSILIMRRHEYSEYVFYLYW